MARIKKNKNVQDKISEMLEVFLVDKESQGKAPKTLKCYEESIKKFIEYIGDISISDLTTSSIMSYRNHMRKEEELKLASINHYLRDLRTFTNYCYKAGYMDNKLNVVLVSGQEEIKETFSEEELEKLLEKPTNVEDFVEWRTYTMIAYILATGNRAETVCGLTIGDIDLSQRIVRIRTAKNKKFSEIAIDKQITTILRKYIKDWRNDALLSEYLFCNITGEKLTTNGFRQAFTKYAKERGIHKTSPHQLRHTFAKMYILNGGSEFKLQQMLGHSSLTMTRHYVSLFGADLARDIDTVSPLVKISKNKGGMEKKIKRNN